MDNHPCILGELLEAFRRVVFTISITPENMEAEPGIEPGLADLQSGA